MQNQRKGLQLVAFMSEHSNLVNNGTQPVRGSWLWLHTTLSNGDIIFGGMSWGFHGDYRS